VNGIAEALASVSKSEQELVAMLRLMRVASGRGFHHIGGRAI
jgi:hypothetical protein